MVSTQRAFIFLKDIEFKEISDRMDPNSVRWQFFTKWENSGDTPTKDLTISLGCDLFFEMHPLPAELPDNVDFPYNDFKDVPIVIGPKAFITAPSITLPEANLDKLKLAIKPHHNQYRFFMWGEAKYRDVFRFTKKHTTRFCVELSFEEQFHPGEVIRKQPIMSYNYYIKHNYAD